MPGETEVANRALRLLKAGRISNRIDGSKNANVVNDVYDEVRDELLRSHTWHFGRKQAQLAEIATAPTFEFDDAYQLPDDWMRTVSVHDNDAGAGNLNFREAEIAGVGAIMVNSESVFLEYVYAVTDTNRMAADFRAAFSYALAVNMPGISNISANAWDKLDEMAIKRLSKAKSADSLGSPAAQRPVGSWVVGRQSWPSSRWPR